MAKRLYEYVVVGGKRKGKSGRVLSTHRKLKKAREAVKERRKEGFHGCLWKRTKREKAGARLSFARKGKEFWLGIETF